MGSASTSNSMSDGVSLDVSPSMDSRVAAGGVQSAQLNQACPISKNQLKKLAKRERMLARRPELRRLEKEKKKRKRLEQAAIRTEKADQDLAGLVLDHKPFRTLMRESENKFRVVLDMDFEEFMTEDEIGKAVKQCKNAYAINRKSPSPCQFYISSVKPGRICDRFATTCNGYTNWDVHLSDRDYIDMFLSQEQQASNDEAKQKARDEIRQKVVYLTADAEEYLPDVDEILKDNSTIFVIGGLVDHNRHKNLCHTRAKERQVRTAKLPINENLKLCQRHILSTVTVFDILLNVLGKHKSWRDALISAIPRRKIDPSEL